MRIDEEYRLIAAQELGEPRAFYEAIGYWPAAGIRDADAALTRPGRGARLCARVLAAGALAVVLLLAMAGASLAQAAAAPASVAARTV